MMERFTHLAGEPGPPGDAAGADGDSPPNAPANGTAAALGRAGLTLPGGGSPSGSREAGRPRSPAEPTTPEPAGLTVRQLLHRPQIWGFTATTASVEFCRGALFLSLLPAYLPQRMGLSVAGVGVVITAQYLADTAFKIPAGWLVDRVGPWRVLVPFLGIAALAVYLLPHARSLVPLVLLALLFGFGTSANWPAVLAGSVHLSGLRSRASATSITFLAWLAAGGLGPVLISFLIGRSYALPFLVLAVAITVGPAVALLGVSGALRSPLDPPWSAGARDERTEETAAALWENLRRSSWLLPGMYVQMLALGMLIPVLVPFSRQVLHLSQAQYGLMLLAGGSVTVLCLMPMGRVVDRFGSKTPLVGGLLLAGTAVVLLVHGGAASLLWRVGLLGLSYALILPAWNGLTVGKIAEGRRGLLLGVFMAIEGTGIATGPVVGGWLYTHVGFQTPFLAAAAVLYAMALFYLVVPAAQYRARREDALAH